MKIPQRPSFFYMTLYSSIIGAAGLVAYFSTTAVAATMQYSGWIFLGFALIIIFTPLGNRRLRVTEKKTSRNYWWILLLLLQLASGVLFLALTQTALVNLPMPPDLNNNSAQLALLNALHFSSLSGGLYPWSMYIVLGVILAYFWPSVPRVYALKESLRPVLHTTVDGMMGAGMDLFFKQSVFMSGAISICVGIVQINNLFSGWLQIPHYYNVHFENLLLGMLIMGGMVSPWQKQVTFYLWQRGISLKLFLPLFIGAVMLFIFIFTFLDGLITPYIQHFPGVQVHSLSAQGWLAYWQIFIYIWWLGWAPLIAYFIARLSAGRSARQIILVGLLLPVVVSLWQYMVTLPRFTANILIFFNFLQNWYLILPLTLLGLIIACVWLNETALTRLLASTGSGRGDNPRLSIKSLRNLLLLIATALVIYPLAGIHFIAVAAFGTALACFIAMGAMCLGFALTRRCAPPSPASGRGD